MKSVKYFRVLNLRMKAEDLVGKYTVIVANMKPRKMRFGMSEGMLLVAGPGDKNLWLLEPQICINAFLSSRVVLILGCFG